jgi:RNA polymerase primary sigma factor
MIAQRQALRRPTGGRATDGRDEMGARLYQFIPDQVAHVPNPDYLCPGMEGKLFGPEAPTVSVAPWRPPFGLDERQEEIELPKAAARLTRENEALLFMRYNYARYRLGALVAEQRKRFVRGRVSEILAWHRRAHANRAALTQANMGLVLAMVRRLRINSVEFDELVSEGNMALLRTVDKFDVARGFKFSTYACGAILRALSRLVSKAGTYHQRFPINFVPEMEESDESQRRNADQRELNVEDLRQVLVRNRARLTDLEQAVLGARFAVAGFDRAHTLREVSELVQLSGERVRQVQNGALSKLRLALEPTSLPRQRSQERRPGLRRSSGKAAIASVEATPSLAVLREA